MVMTNLSLLFSKHKQNYHHFPNTYFFILKLERTVSCAVYVKFVSMLVVARVFDETVPVREDCAVVVVSVVVVVVVKAVVVSGPSVQAKKAQIMAS